MKAVILAGGLGARMKPFTDALPKPMLPIGTKPILEIHIEYLRRFGFDDIVLAINYLKGNIIHYFGDGRNGGVRIRYSEETTLLGTAGAVKKAAQGFNESFVVMVADGIADIDYHELMAFHHKSKASGTMVVFEKKLKLPYGLVNLDIDKDNIILDLREKPEVTLTVNTGITVLEPESLEYMATDEYVRMPDLFLRMKSDGRKIVAYRHSGNWIDIGQDIEQYIETNRKILNKEIQFSPVLEEMLLQGYK